MFQHIVLDFLSLRSYTLGIAGPELLLAICYYQRLRGERRSAKQYSCRKQHTVKSTAADTSERLADSVSSHLCATLQIFLMVRLLYRGCRPDPLIHGKASRHLDPGYFSVGPNRASIVSAPVIAALRKKATANIMLSSSPREFLRRN